ncbi:MAG TPA: hypothetical protein VF625_02325 [Longimicrobium sp.]|jgi:hypothetical protein
MIWLGESRGYLTDYVTQRWVQLTGQPVDLGADPWLAGPVGHARGIGREFFAELARREGLELHHGAGSHERGLISDFGALAAPDFDPERVDPAVIDFYARTSAYELDAWAEWRGTFRPFGSLLGRLFSRRLQQLNMPLSALDTSRGVTSAVVQLIDPATGQVRHTAWMRELLGTGNVLYAGTYSLAAVPGRRGRCVKVVFPLPNGNAVVLMRPEVHEDGSLTIVSAGKRFGDPGFYFTVHDRGRVRARYVRAMRERIRVYPAEHGAVRADHVLTLWGVTFLRLHYRLRPRTRAANALTGT